jgi:energy-coupling factor transporter transmembrane protein EcfT
MGAYILLLVWARLLPAVVRRLWRLKWVLLILFLVDWLVISLDLALVVTLRLVLLAGAFLLFFATTTPGELRRALEWMGVPHRYAFSVSLAFQSVSLLDQEWQTIREAHQARGGWMVPTTGWRNLRERVRDLVALAVPAVVMTAERAWLMTEAAYARGFDSPRRRSYQQLKMRRMDWMLLTGALAASLALVLWRWRM